MQIDLGDFASTLLLQEEREEWGFFQSATETDCGEDDEYFIEVVGSMYEVAPVRGTTLDIHGRPYELRLQGRPNPREGALRGTILLGASRKAWGGYPKDVTRSVRIRMIP